MATYFNTWTCERKRCIPEKIDLIIETEIATLYEKNMLSYVITIYFFQRYANKMLVKKVFLILWNLQCFNWLSTVDEITSLLKCILQICGIFAMIYFSLFLKSYFNFSIFSRKKNPDRNDVCERHNVFRIVKIAFVKKKIILQMFSTSA